MSSKPLNEYTFEEFARHNNEADGYWLLMDGLVYDVSQFKKHPGQFGVFEKYAGTDVTKKFDEIHSSEAREMRKKFLIGRLKAKEAASGVADQFEVKNVVPESNVPGYYYLLPVFVLLVMVYFALRNNGVI